MTLYATNFMLDLEDEEEWQPSREASKEFVCGDCGGNCDPECGTHPWGCLWSGIVYGEWAVDTRCKLSHDHDVALGIARRNLEFLSTGVKVQRSFFAK